jgi:hypothetical protein
MKRMLMTAMASSLLALAAPGVASAHHSKHHHGGHHAIGHSRHAKGSRLVTFTATSGPGATSGAPASSPATTGDTAGTVTSFENGVLTITLADKKTVVSGKVTDLTEVRCEPAASSAGPGDDEGSGDDQSESDGPGHGDNSASARAANHEQDSQDTGEGGDGNDEEAEASCTTADLKPGALVRKAELRLTSTGAEWEKVVLVR